MQFHEITQKIYSFQFLITQSCVTSPGVQSLYMVILTIDNNLISLIVF